MEFNSRRSPVYSCNGMVSSSQPLASEVGAQVLRNDGNAADACIAMSAVLSVTEPCSTGVGGDAFCIFYDSKNSKTYILNGSGKSSRNVSLVEAKSVAGKSPTLPETSPLSVTVPGAVQCWCDVVDRFGEKSLEDLLRYAISLAENGYPVAPITAYHWLLEEHKLRYSSGSSNDLLLDGRAPKAGQIIRLSNMANTLRKIARNGRKGFYEGEIAIRIIDKLNELGNPMDAEDFKQHETLVMEPISIDIRGHEIIECPPNGQGVISLVSLLIIEALREKIVSRSDLIHLQIESLRLAFKKCYPLISDPDYLEENPKEWLSKASTERLARQVDMKCSQNQDTHPQYVSDTVYLCAVDKHGNACSFINSNYCGFGTGIIPDGLGFSLHNRGSNFSLKEKRSNCFGPSKRPLHTIIPGLVINKEKRLLIPFGVMGAFMQPQAHVQVLSNLINDQMDPQEALDAPRFCIEGEEVKFEDNFPEEIIRDLENRGHRIKVISGRDKFVFGRGQLIIKSIDDKGNQILCGGSDPRADGMTIGY